MQHELGERLLSYPLISPEVAYPLCCKGAYYLVSDCNRHKISLNVRLRCHDITKQRNIMVEAHIKIEGRYLRVFTSLARLALNVKERSRGDNRGVLTLSKILIDLPSIEGEVSELSYSS